MQDGKLRVIEYASRTFSKTERAYCVTRREMLAMHFALKHFRNYLLGRKFTLKVDHMALTYYSRSAEPVGQQARFLDYFSQFDFDIEHRAGAKHINADSLSRLRPCERDNGEPCRQCNKRVTGVHTVAAVHTRVSNKTAHPGNVLLKKPKTVSRAPLPASDTTFDQNSSMDVQDSQATVDDQQPSQPTAKAKPKRQLKPKRTVPIIPSQNFENWDSKYLSKLQSEDLDIAPAMEWCKIGKVPDWNSVNTKVRERERERNIYFLVTTVYIMSMKNTTY
jgi:hypothetical protein